MIPETPTRVREILAERGLRPNRRLGQHFLADPNLRDAIVAAAAVRPGDVVLEVGPGLGALTKGLLGSGAEVVAVERDRGLCAFLEEAFAGESRLTLVRADVLRKREIAPVVREALAGRTGRFLVVSNLPYSAATPFLAAMARADSPPERVVVMVQKEVALRMAGRPGSADYGPLAVLLTLRGEVRILRDVGSRVFVPPPPIRSALVEFLPLPGSPERALVGARAARTAFLHRRKCLRRALTAAGRGREEVERALQSLGIDPEERAENLSPEQFVAIGRVLGME